MIAYIPARGGSKRIPRKNIKLLAGKPIIAHVIETVKSLEFIEKVYVSTEDSEIQSIAEALGIETKELRKASLANDNASFMDLIRKDVPRFAENSKDLLFVLPTAALSKKKQYDEAYDIYKKHSPQILMSSVEYPISPLWAMTEGSNGYWKPLHPEAIKKKSQDLPLMCADAGLFYMMKWKEIQNYETLMVDRLLVYNVPSDIAVDVDTPSDWQRLELLYKKSFSGK